jgi:acetyl esterase/lipase
MWFHGGGFKPADDKRQIYIPWFAKAFASRGCIGIAPDYRTRPDPETDKEGAVRDAMADARMALEWVRTKGRTYTIDTQRLVLAGGSAGGMLVFNICHDPSQPLVARRDGVFAILGMWGSPGGEARLFAEVNPLSPPTFLVHGTADMDVPYEWSRTLSEELTQAGVENVLLSLPDVPHCPLAHMDQIIDRAAQFLHKYLTEVTE